MFLTDNETKIDLLNSESIAQTIVKLLREKPDHPITIGVHGDWGAGKSSVLEMIEQILEQEDKVLCIKFNGWRFQGFEDAKIALIEGIVNELVKRRSLLTKAKDEVVDIFERIDWLKVAKKTGSALITGLTGIPTGDVVQSVIQGLNTIAGDPLKLATKENLEGLAEQAGSILKPKESGKNIPKEIAEFREAFDKLLVKAGIEQLIVLVDDLDRCLPDTAIETLEAIRLFVFTNKTAFVIAADEGMIGYAVKKHFPDLPDSLVYQAYTRNYLEKLIQIPFRIPILGEAETKIYVTLLLIGVEIGECAEFDALIKIARELLRKPWESQPLDSDKIKTALGTKAQKAQNAQLLSDQIGPVLANGTKGNPRQIKRFLNTLLLRHRTAEARGFGDAINLPVMAKLLIAERFISGLYEQIAIKAAASPSGFCEELKILETTLKATGSGTRSRKKEVKTEERDERSEIDESLLLEWTSSGNIKEWAQIQPSLAETDLRPYIFVAKDKKDFFGTSSSLGHLASLIEKLLGGKMVVKTVEADIKGLGYDDTIRVFEEIRARIIGKSVYDSMPDGIEGISLLVKTHDHLQERLVDFLSSLPKQKLGPWVLKGWDQIITGSAKSKFDTLVDQWAIGGGMFLKTAAQGVQKMRKTI